MTKQKTVLLIGGTGFVGKLIGMHLTEQGYAIHCVGIEAPDVTLALGYPCQYYRWDGKGTLPDEAIQNVSIVINCAGCPVANGRWQPTNRHTIVASRIRATEVAVDAATRTSAKVMIQASSMDYYGDTDGQEVSEDSPVGRGFWPEAIARWECAASALPATTRLVTLRMAEIHSIYGGRLRGRLYGYGKRMGSPSTDPQHTMNFIHSTDFVRLVHKAIEDERWQGPINAAAPRACTMAELHEELCRYFPTFTDLRIPPWLRSLSPALSLAERDAKGFNQKAVPHKPKSLGFRFDYPDIAASLQSYLDHNSSDCFYYTSNCWLPASPQEIWDYFGNAHNWAKINPTSIKFKVKPGSNTIAEEGKEFNFNIYYFGFIRGNWRMRHTSREPYRLAKSIVQEGSMDMVEVTQSLTPVAQGTRLDEIVRYQSPVSPIFLPLTEKISRRANQSAFSYRRQVLAATFTGEPQQNNPKDRKVG